MNSLIAASFIHKIAIGSLSPDLSETCEGLETAARRLAQEPDFRLELGQLDEPPLWADLITLWSNITDSTRITDESFASGRLLRTLSQPLARFTRNIVAGVPQNQLKAEAIEPSLRHLIYHLTSFYHTQDADLVPYCRLFVQTLSNIVAANNEIQDRIWDLYMTLPEEKSILLRLLASPDIRTKIATSVLILNCVHDSHSRASLTVSNPSGRLVCRALLDICATYLEADSHTEEGQLFEISYQVFKDLFNGQLFPKLWTLLINPDEFITLHQTTILKIFDAYLQTQSSFDVQQSQEQVSFLISSHLSFCGISRRIINSFLPSENGDTVGVQTLDPRLSVVIEAVVLLSQCLITILLKEEEQRSLTPSRPCFEVVKNAATSSGEENAINIIIDLLKSLDLFLPRINLGQPQFSPTQPQHRGVLKSDPTGFAYVKRDLVRLLGVLSHEDREIQDQVRNCGGIQVVMNLCVVDERNPYLREHALFALRNILHRNEENQNVVAEIKPMKEWNEDGVLVNAENR